MILQTFILWLQLPHWTSPCCSWHVNNFEKVEPAAITTIWFGWACCHLNMKMSIWQSNTILEHNTVIPCARYKWGWLCLLRTQPQHSHHVRGACTCWWPWILGQFSLRDHWMLNLHFCYWHRKQLQFKNKYGLRMQCWACRHLFETINMDPKRWLWSPWCKHCLAWAFVWPSFKWTPQNIIADVLPLCERSLFHVHF